MQSDELITPFDVEQEMIDLNRRIDHAPSIIRDNHNMAREARLEFKRQWALAYRRADGTQADRKAYADLETIDAQVALDQAEVTYRYVSDLLDAYKTKLRALQSISSLMKAQMFAPEGGA